MKYFFILNPMAGEGKNETKLRTQIDELDVADNCELYVTKGEKDATLYVQNQCSKYQDEDLMFIACGGDGTFSEVCNGAVNYKNAIVSCVPCGSGNDFVKTFGGADRFLDISKIVHAPIVDMDAIKVGDHYCVNVLNFGFDTTVAIHVQERRAKLGHGSKSSYTEGIIKALITSVKNEFKVYADGELLNPDGLGLFCTLGNGQYVGGSFKCAPRAVIDDGWIEVCILKPCSRLRVPMLIGPYSKGEHLDNKSFKDLVIYRRAKKVEVFAPDGFAYSNDGEIIYENHFVAEIVEHALRLALPEM